MMASIRYELATLAHLPALETAGDDLFDLPIKPDRAREFLNDPRHHLILAYDGTKAVGMASGFHYVHPDKNPALFVNEVGVLEDYQKQGIGRKLVKKLCDHGRKLGCSEAWVGTNQSNLNARKAYGAAGGKENAEPFILIEFDLEKGNSL